MNAKQLATSFFSAVTHIPSEQLLSEGVSIVYRAYADETADGQGNAVCFYVVNVGPKGFVMLSGDDRLTPVLGYSFESSFKPQDMPANLRQWFEGKRKEISYALSMEDFSATPEITEQWNHLSEIGSSLSVVVQPLLQTTWDQNAYYNQYCPEDLNGPNGHAYAGCVAAAMAQIIRYWQWPWSGFNSHSYTCDYGSLSVDFSSANYNFNNMPNYIYGGSTSTQIDAVATLTYHCGVSVDMDYSPDGSGAYTVSVSNALRRFFAYANFGTYVNKADYSHNEWDNLIQNELNNARPVYYSGSSEDGGHAFVCDGYDNNGNYHFNWGWSGYYNGYFTLNALTPGASHDYSENQEAIIGISAIESSLCCSEEVMSFYTPVGGESLAQILTVRGHSLNDIITITVESDFIISANGNDYGITATLPSAGGNLYVKYTPNSEGNVLRTLTLNSGSITESVSLSGNPIEVNCFPPQDLTGAYQGSSVKLSWNVPISYANNSPASTTLSWDSTVTDNFYSIANDITYCMVHRFEISDLNPYHQYQLTKVSFVASPFADSYRIVVYKGGNYNGGVFNPGELVLNQVVPMGSINVIGWNTVTLGNPVMVDASQELWFGVIAYSSGNNGGAYVIRLGTNAAVDGYGNLLGLVEGNSDGTGGFDSWISLDNGNFPIKGTVEKVSTCGIHYDVYRRNTLLGSTGNTSFIDNNPLSDTCTYVVSSVWDNDCSGDAFVTVNSPVITLALDNIFGTDSASATAEATVVNNGESQITSCGVCWSASPNPTLADRHSMSGDYTMYNYFYAYDGKFTSALTGISKDTIYYVRAYVINEYGISYSDQQMYVHFDNLIDVNNVAAYFSVGALQYKNNNAFYKVPKDSQTSSIFGHSLWLSGVDENDSLHLSAGGHSIFADVVNYTGMSACEDFWPGPLSTIDASTDSATVARWNRCFKITREEVLDFLLHYDEPGYTIPFHIVSWPAHGDTTKGQAYNIAPFVDVDGDNHYDPSHGDYPSFPGDMALFFVFNDKPAKRTPIGGMPIGVEVHTMVYGYDAPQDSVLNNTLFVKYKLFNRSQTDLHEAYASLWTDWDVGDAYDDRVGCYVKNNTAYAYNATTVDGSGLPAHYGPNPPIQTLTILGGPLISADGLDNPSFTDTTDCGLYVFDGNNQYAITGTNFGNGIVDDERMGMTGFVSFNNNVYSVVGDPHTAVEFHNLMRNRWKDGTHLIYGGSGYPQDGVNGPECRFIFPGTSDPCNWGVLDTIAYGGFHYEDYGGTDGWREETVGFAGDDRRGVVNMGPFDFAAGSMQEIDYCMITLFPTYTDTTVVTAQQLQSIDTLLHQYTDNYIGEYLFVPEMNIDETICAGGQYEYCGSTYTKAGNYSVLIRDNGRDTVVRIHLTVMENPISSVLIPDMCSGGSYALTEGYGTQYTIEGPWITMTNDSLFVVNPPADIAQDTVVPYYINMQYDNTCEFDTTVFITCYAANLTLKDTVVCENELPFEWNGVSFTEAGFIYDTLLAVNGCDSVVMINLNVTNCGVIVDEKSCPAAPTVTDIDGNVYGTVQIGGQCWMRENLRTTRYADGTDIYHGGGIRAPAGAYSYWCYPNDNADNKQSLGLLYSWNAVMHNALSSDGTPSDVQGICPSGWHVPSDAEWTQLTDYISSQSQYWCSGDSTKIAKALAGTTGWTTTTYGDTCNVNKNQSDNNATGFGALPAGQLDYNYYSSGSANYWSSTEASNNYAKSIEILYTNSVVYRYATHKRDAYSVRCILNENDASFLPVITTSDVTSITTNTAVCGGYILSSGGSPLISSGICWSTAHHPRVTGRHTVDGAETGIYTSNLTELASNITYYVRAYATNLYGTVYGNEISFTTSIDPNGDQYSCQESPFLTDIDGNVYNTVQIGGQCWMRENLRTTHYADGNDIAQGNNVLSTDIFAFSSTPAYWYYPGGDSTYQHHYGLLYNWKALMYNESSSDATPSGVQGICPTGWHIPSDAEWTLLTDYLSSQSQYICGENNSNIAKALSSTTGWTTSNNLCYVGNNQADNNSTHFGAFPAGRSCGHFYSYDFGYYTIFWSSTENNSATTWTRRLYTNVVDRSSYNKVNWYSVRCLRNEDYSQNFPSITTYNVTDITDTTANCGGVVAFNGNVEVSARGVCWSTVHNPTINGTHTIDGSGIGNFNSNITGLATNVTFYVRAYATTVYGTVYGNEVSFTIPINPNGDARSCPTLPTLTDIDGNEYNTVQIGTQCWMRENLKTTHYDDGSVIALGSSNSLITTSSYTTPCRYYPNDDFANVANYGYLYNGVVIYDTISSNGTKHLCPTGWHLPSGTEWAVMTNYVRGTYNSSVAKALSAQTGWAVNEMDGTPGNNQTDNNATGFSARPAGTYGHGYFGSHAQYWRYDPSEQGRYHYIANNSTGIGWGWSASFYAYSIRCVHDESTSSDNKPCFGTPTVTDIDGNVYNTVQIGDQCWMRENLRTSKYADGTSISEGGDTNSSTVNPYYYNYASSTIPLFRRGYLYNWSAAMHDTASNSTDPSSVQGICPDGWHIPSDAEWTQLTNYVSSRSEYVFGGSFIAQALASTTDWDHINYNAPYVVGYDKGRNNATGYSAIPAGYNNGSSFVNEGQSANFWSSTQYSAENAYYRSLNYNSSYVGRSDLGKNNGLSIRCLLNPPCTPTSSEFHDTVCTGDNYTWNGETYTESGDYVQTFQTAYGCDSIVTLHLTVAHSTDTIFTAVVVENDLPYYFNGYPYYLPGAYTDTLLTVHGCDSIVTLHLTVLNNVSVSCDSAICGSELPLVWNDSIFTEAGTRTAVLLASTGADSIVVMNLYVSPTTHGDTVVSSCGSFEWYGETYTRFGEYTHVLTSTYGCDSIVTLHLTVNHSDTVYYSAVFCDSYEWNGTTYTESGVYPVHLTNSSGCDSIVTLNLTVIHSTDTTFTVTVVENDLPYHINDNIAFMDEGEYTVVIPNETGCDSIINLSLVVSHNVAACAYDTICETELPFTWNEVTFHTAGDSAATVTLTAASGADSMFTMHLHVDTAVCVNAAASVCFGDTYDDLGFLAVITADTVLTDTVPSVLTGCDSITTVAVTMLAPTATTVIVDTCDTFTWIDGITYTESTNTPTVTLSNLAGCDSIVTLHLTISNTDYTDITDVSCDSYTWNGITYTESGVYPLHLTNSSGCDSVVSLYLTVNQSDATDLYATACDSYNWNSTTYTESGTYPLYLTNTMGCDSVVTLHLTINHSDTVEFSATACNSYNWNGITYTQSGDYTTYTTNAAGCDLALVLHLTVNHSDTTDLYVNACDNYFWNGTTYHASGNYAHSFTNVAGCDSVVTLHLTISSTDYSDITEEACDGYIWNGEAYSESGVYTQTLTNVHGCDSVVTLHLTISNTDSTEITEEACDGYDWNGEAYSESGVYTQTLTNVHGCDSVVTLHLTVHQSDATDLYATACDSYDWNGSTYTESGAYPLYLTNAVGCDSVVTLHLTINHSDTVEFSATACNSYNWNGVTYTESGDYTTYMTNASGCNLLLVLHLTVNNSDTTDLYASACDSYFWNGTTYHASGNYAHTFTNEASCDSVVTLHLTISNTDYTDVTEVVCDSYTWNGEVYTESGVYTQTLTNVNGCDSIVTLHLTISNTSHIDVTEDACDSYNWNGEVYTESGLYTKTLTNVAGCDSVVTLHLTVNYSDTVYYYATACNSYNWNGETYTESGDYAYYTTMATGCTLVAILHLTIYETEITEFSITTTDSCYIWNDITYCNSGDYIQLLQTVDGCDSIVTLHLSITVGIDDHELTNSMILYPNPTDNIVNVQLSIDQIPEISDVEIQLYDMYGKFLQTVPVKDELTSIDLSSYASGVYFVKAVVKGQVLVVRKVVRE